MKYLLYCIVFLTACVSKPGEKSEEFKMILPDTTIKHNPKWGYEIVQKSADLIGLQKINRQIKGFELRVWLNSLYMPDRVLLFQSNGERLRAEALDIFYHFDSSKLNLPINERSLLTDIIIDSVVTNNLGHTVKINEFKKTIDSFNIREIPDQGVTGVLDGYLASHSTTITIEFANSSYYKLVTYIDADAFPNEKNNLQVNNLIKYIRNHFELIPK